jgi:hypothetical protein
VRLIRATATKIVDARPAKPEKVYDWNKERQYWAFQKPKAAAPPKVGMTNRGRRRDVDHFVLAKLEAKGLKPVRRRRQAHACPPRLL